jgi:peptidyl-dipeptidase A
MNRISLHALALSLLACGGTAWQPPPCPTCGALVEPAQAGHRAGRTAEPDADAEGPATPEEARAFVARVEIEIEKLDIAAERSAWVARNFITMDTQEIAAAADEALLAFLAQHVKEAARFDGLDLDPVTARKLALLKRNATLPAPRDAAKTAELAKIASDLGAAYATGRYCPKKGGALRRELTDLNKKEKDKDKAKATDKLLACDPEKPDSGGFTIDLLGKFMGDSRDEAALREAWVGWHSVAPPMRRPYARLVEIANEGAREIGFDDVGALWRSGYDMSPEEFRADAARLMKEVNPLYTKLHCYARKRLREKYGDKLVPPGKPIPAHLLGNMWSQTWGNIFPLLEPYPKAGSIDVTKAIEKKGLDEVGMVKTAEAFFVSLGMDKLPDTFWKRSLLKRPADREVDCHASAWDVHFNDDLRIKMCVQRTDDELYTLHHELGHNYYFHYYVHQPILFKAGANDGFHEAIGDTIALSVTPKYLEQIKLIDKAPENDKAEVNYLMKMALDKIAFMPFGKLIDEWRWDVFAGKVPITEYNRAWWRLRTEYQGIAPPEPRSPDDFDPGAKYHVPGNVPYTRYFLAFIYQFQFQRALCRIAGHTGPLHKCSIYGNKAAGDKLKAMLALGSSRPWQQALAALSGEKAGDATAILEYFQPLGAFLDAETKGETCGW